MAHDVWQWRAHNPPMLGRAGFIYQFAHAAWRTHLPIQKFGVCRHLLVRVVHRSGSVVKVHRSNLPHSPNDCVRGVEWRAVPSGRVSIRTQREWLSGSVCTASEV